MPSDSKPILELPSKSALATNAIALFSFVFSLSVITTFVPVVATPVKLPVKPDEVTVPENTAF